MVKARKTKGYTYKSAEEKNKQLKVEISILKDAYFQLKKTKEALRESEEKYRETIDNITDVIVVFGTDGIVTYVTPNVSLYGYCDKEIIGHNFLKFVHPDDHPMVMENFEMTLKTKKDVPTEFRLMKKDGTFIYAEERGKPTKKGSEIIQITTVIRDITEKKKAEKALKKAYDELENKVKKRTKALEQAKKGAEQKAGGLEKMKTAILNILEDVKEAEEQIKEEKKFSESILKAMPDGLSIIDKDYNLIFMNKTFLDLFGEKSVGKKCYEVYKDNKKKCLNCPVTKDLKIGETRTVEISDMAGGRTFWMAHRGILLSGKKHILEIFKDITERKEIDRAKNEFISLTSHQLRTPLTGIKWLIQAVLKRGDLNKWQIDFLEDALKSNERMVNLVNDLLNISRLEAGVVGVEPQKTDITNFINEIIKEVKVDVSLKRQKIQFKKPKQKIIVSMDRQLIGQVIINLFSNAIKYNKPNKTITVSVKKDKTSVHVSVEDQGIGLSKEDQKKLFTKFFRSEQASRVDTKGSGLGLYIAKKILEACEGSIQCSSAVGKGSVFTITFPLKGSKSKKGQKELIVHKMS